jgi:acetyltransferase-like isoleucine patch superfamily enzyme
MDIDDVKLDEELESLWRQLKRLHRALRDHTYKRYSRVNPFVENLFDWKEKGEFFGGKNVTIYDSTTIVGDVKIGDHTWIGPFCSLDGTAGLVIGRYCSISLGCQLLTHDTVKWALSGGKMSYEYANTKIGDCCFLGSYTVISKGVTIGNHCLIAAGAVVTKDVGDFIIAGGVPARPIGRVHLDSQGKVHLVYNKL